MCDTLKHRGPDGYGEYFDAHAALGHRRLSIIDLSGGAQPLGNEDASIQVTFNGEIYNFLELREELESKGHHFQTRTDTEVLVHLYEEVGERLPEYLNGMFAFAIWDRPRRKLFLARDRFGEKPLYYTNVPGRGFCFASELKALAVLPGFRKRVRPASVADYLCFSYIPDPDTIYENVFRLKPGHSLTVTASGFREQRYWSPSFSSSYSLGRDEAIEQIRSLSEDCVRRRMVSDVPIGAFLSGGVDSSAVVAFMAGNAPDRSKTFCIGFSDPKFDESRYARIVADRYHTEHYEKTVRPSIQEMLPVAMRHYDEPFADASAIPTLYVSKLTREHVTVALSGDGGDEVFGGYRRYRHGVVESRLRSLMPQWFRNSLLRTATEFVPRTFRARNVLNNISLVLSDAYFNAVTGFRDESLNAVLSPDLRKQLRTYSPREAWRKRFLPYSHLSPLQQMQGVDFETYLPADILVKVDRATMAYSLESRAPWLDHRLAELACGLPSDLHIGMRAGKLAFKRAVSSLLPAEVIHRPKMGFSVPLSEWLHGELYTTFERLVFRPEMDRYVSLPEVRRLWKESRAGVTRHNQNLWTVFMLSCWDVDESTSRNTEELVEATSKI